MTKAQAAIRSAQDLLAATHLEKQFHWHSTHLSRTHELPSQRALAAAARARARLHAKWLKSHPWAAHLGHLSAAQSQTLAARPTAQGAFGDAAMQAAVGDFGMNEGPAGHTPGLAGYVQGAPAAPAPLPAPAAGGAAGGGGVLLRPDAYGPPMGQEGALVPASAGAVPAPSQPSPVRGLSPLQAAGSAGAAAESAGAPPVLETHGEGFVGEGAAASAAAATSPPAPPPFHPCTNQGCDMEKMLNMPPLVDEVNRSWVGDDTNRTWLDAMTGGHAVGSSMKASPFEEIGSGPGQYYVRRFDKETVPGWWETEPGPGDPQGGMIPGPHDRVYHGLEQNTKGEWKKEADGKGGFRWVRLVCAI